MQIEVDVESYEERGRATRRKEEATDKDVLVRRRHWRVPRSGGTENQMLRLVLAATTVGYGSRGRREKRQTSVVVVVEPDEKISTRVSINSSRPGGHHNAVTPFGQVADLMLISDSDLDLFVDRIFAGPRRASEREDREAMSAEK